MIFADPVSGNALYTGVRLLSREFRKSVPTMFVSRGSVEQPENPLCMDYLNGTNATIATECLTIVWTFTAIGKLIFNILVVILNSGMLYVFLTEKTLRSSFTVYLISLLTCNILYTFMDAPLDAFREISSHWWLGDFACSVYIYEIYVFAAVVMNTHVLITTNRIWAITFPISYRQNHDVKTAILIFFGMFLYVHVIVLPGFLLDLLYYRAPVETGCNLNVEAQPVWAIFIQFLIYDGPVVFIGGAFPFLWYQQKKKRVVVRNTEATETRYVTGTDTENTDVQGKKPLVKLEKRKKLSRSFLILTFLTCSILICWTPEMTYYTIECFASVDLDKFSRFASMLYSLQALFDPILFALSLEDVRNAIKRLLRL